MRSSNDFLTIGLQFVEMTIQRLEDHLFSTAYSLALPFRETKKSKVGLWRAVLCIIFIVVKGSFPNYLWI